MSKYRFIPNERARENFNLVAAAYEGLSRFEALESAIGREDCLKYEVTPMPLSGGRTESEVVAIFDRTEKDRAKRVQVIGTMQWQAVRDVV